MALTRLAPLTLVITFASAPAGALDITGTWSGKFTCSNFDGLTYNTVSDKKQTLYISQYGENVSVEWVDEANNTTVTYFTGSVIAHQNKPSSKGQVALADCSTGPELNAYFSEIAKLSASVNLNTGTGTLTGTSIYSIPDSPEAMKTVGQCKWNFKRVNPQDPQVTAGCPG
ncbi:hypothetical protein [Methylomicrobium lacus]|uniref:hypothetical protein n=1 Tax=Methylomicrobium lacus TaxID=136992 RepID=UPI0035A96EE0